MDARRTIGNRSLPSAFSAPPRCVGTTPVRLGAALKAGGKLCLPTISAGPRRHGAARREMKKTLLGVLVVAVVFATNALAQAKTVITIGGSDKIVYLPAKLAERLGYFQAQGVASSSPCAKAQSMLACPPSRRSHGC